MNIFVRWTIILLVVASIILLVFPVSWFPSFYDVRYMGWIGLGGAALIIILPWLARVKETAPDAGRKNKAADLMQMFLALMVASNALGDLGLYKLYLYGFEYDKVLHFFTPFLGALLIPFILNLRWGIRKSYAVLATFVIVVVCGAGWEVFEVAVDFVLKTHISGVYGLNVSRDTAFDFMFDVLGVALGLFGSFFLRGYFIGEKKIEKANFLTATAAASVFLVAVGFFASYAKM